MKTIILASLATLAIAATSWDMDPVRSRWDARLGWDHREGLAFDLQLVVHAGA